MNQFSIYFFLAIVCFVSAYIEPKVPEEQLQACFKKKCAQLDKTFSELLMKIFPECTNCKFNKELLFFCNWNPFIHQLTSKSSFFLFLSVLVACRDTKPYHDLAQCLIEKCQVNVDLLDKNVKTPEYAALKNCWTKCSVGPN